MKWSLLQYFQVLLHRKVGNKTSINNGLDAIQHTETVS